MIAQTAILLALAAASNAAAAPGIRASVSSQALNYLAVSRKELSDAIKALKQICRI